MTYCGTLMYDLRTMLMMVGMLWAAHFVFAGTPNGDSMNVLEFRGYLTIGSTTLYRIDVVGPRRMARSGWYRMNDMVANTPIHSFDRVSETLFVIKDGEICALKIGPGTWNPRSGAIFVEVPPVEPEELLDFNRRVQIKVAAITQLRAERLQMEAGAIASVR